MRKLIVTIPGLKEGQARAIRERAEANGFKVLFFDRNADALSEAGDAEVIFGNAPDLARAAAQLKWLCTPSAGVNQYAGAGGFANASAMLSNSSGAYGVTISEHILMLALELLRRQPEYTDIVRRREWKKDLPVRSIHGSRVTLLGTGDIGQQTVRRLRGFMPERIIGVNRWGRNPGNLFDRVVPMEGLDQVLPETDLLIMSLPGTDETRHVMDGRRLDLLPVGAYIVNVGRGNSIDQRALETRLREGRLHAALDVFETEPLPADDSLWDCPNLLITPHAAGNMTLAYTKQRIVEMFLEDFDNYCAGKPLVRRVDIRQGY